MQHRCPQPFRVPVPSSLLQIWLSTPGHSQTGSSDGGFSPPCSPTTPLPSPIHRPNPSWMAPKPYPGRAELPRCCGSRSGLAARPSVTSSAPLPCSRLPSPRLPLPAGSPRGTAEPVAGSGHGSCCHPGSPRAAPCAHPQGGSTGAPRAGGFSSLEKTPPGCKAPEGAAWGLLWLLCPSPCALPGGVWGAEGARRASVLRGDGGAALLWVEGT